MKDPIVAFEAVPIWSLDGEPVATLLTGCRGVARGMVGDLGRYTSDDFNLRPVRASDKRALR